jgi:hypothetical protein
MACPTKPLTFPVDMHHETANAANFNQMNMDIFIFFVPRHFVCSYYSSPPPLSLSEFTVDR